MHRFHRGLVAFIASLSVSCTSLGLRDPELAPLTLNLQGAYDWIDAFGHRTGCIVRIFWQDGEYRGLVYADQNFHQHCPWDGYVMGRLIMRGDRVRTGFGCPHAGCPDASIEGGASYLFDVVRGVMLSGKMIGGIPHWRDTSRWRELRLVQRPSDNGSGVGPPGA